jgi:hypothetical protein
MNVVRDAHSTPSEPLAKDKQDLAEAAKVVPVIPRRIPTWLICTHMIHLTDI